MKWNNSILESHEHKFYTAMLTDHLIHAASASQQYNSIHPERSGDPAQAAQHLSVPQGLPSSEGMLHKWKPFRWLCGFLKSF